MRIRENDVKIWNVQYGHGLTARFSVFHPLVESE
jgi:hypothetical protein